MLEIIAPNSIEITNEENGVDITLRQGRDRTIRVVLTESQVKFLVKQLADMKEKAWITGS